MFVKINIDVQYVQYYYFTCTKYCIKIAVPYVSRMFLCIYPGESPSVTFCQSIYIFLFVFYIAVSVCCEIQSVKCFSFSCGMHFRKYSFSCTLFNTASYYALRFHCVGGCWDRTQDCCNLGMTDRPLNTRLDLILI